MKKWIALLSVLAMAVCCFAFAEEANDVFTKDVVILYTSDIHGGITSGFGLSGVTAIRDQLSRENYVLLVDDGDACQGEPVSAMTEGKAVISLMNKAGYDIATVGNHEFDYGMDAFFTLKDLAEFPYISCNFFREGERVLDPYVIREFDGVKIGFVGVSTPATITSSTPKIFQDADGNFIYDFCRSGDGTLFYETVQASVDAVRAEGASYVVVMAHLGNEASAMPYTYYDLIAHTSGIDAVLDGHSHDTEQTEMTDLDGKTVLRTACGTKLECVGYLRIAKDGTLSTGLYNWGDREHSAQETFGIRNEVSEAADQAMSELDEALGEVVATAEYDLTVEDPELKDLNGKPIRIVRSQETNLGDLCADAYRAVTGADIGVINGGGVRANLRAGSVTRADILRVNPYGNTLCVLEVTGQTMLDALEHAVHALPDELGAFLHVSGMTFEVDSSLPTPVITDEDGRFIGIEGERRVSNARVGNEPLDPKKTYTLAGIDHTLLNNGGGYTQFDDCTVLRKEVMTDVEALLRYITGDLGGVIGEEYADPYGQGRITIR